MKSTLQKLSTTNFAETSDKAQLLEYAMNKLAERLTVEEAEVLRTWENKIDEV